MLCGALVAVVAAYADSYSPVLTWEHNGLDTQGEPEQIAKWRVAIKYIDGVVLETQELIDADGSLRRWQMSPIPIGEGSGGHTVISGTLPATYIWERLTVGGAVYVDRNYTFSAVPEGYQEMDVLRTANSDKAKLDNSVQFNISNPETIYVAHDKRVTTKPAWLADWTNTGVTLQTDDASLEVYSKAWLAGAVILGANVDIDAGSGISMYVVLVDSQASGELAYDVDYTVELVAIDADGNVSEPDTAAMRISRNVIPEAVFNLDVEVACPDGIVCTVIINGVEQ